MFKRNMLLLNSQENLTLNRSILITYSLGQQNARTSVKNAFESIDSSINGPMVFKMAETDAHFEGPMGTQRRY